MDTPKNDPDALASRTVSCSGLEPALCLCGDTRQFAFSNLTRVARGSQSTVFMAEDILSCGRVYAIKRLPRSWRCVWENERQALRAMRDHPNILRLHDCAKNARHCYLVLEAGACSFCDYVENTEEQQNGLCMPEPQAARLFRQVVCGLRACHEVFLCHHDVKLENMIMFDNGNWVKLADFASSVFYSKEDAGNGRKCECRNRGSPAYSSPQLLFGEPHDYEKTDVFSLAVCVYRVLCGKLPFCDPVTDTKENLLKNVNQANVPSLLGGCLCSPDAKDLLTSAMCLAEPERIPLSEVYGHAWFSTGTPEPNRQLPLTG